jgi:predicted membrane protein
MSHDTFREQRRALKRAARQERRMARKRSGSVLAGLLILAVGCILLLKQFGVNFPAWLFSWPMILIAFGLLAGAGNSFRDPGWVIISGIGFVFLCDKLWPNIPIHHFIWPILIIALGLIIILAPRRYKRWHSRFDEQWKDYSDKVTTAATDSAAEVTDLYQKKGEINDNQLNVVSIFGNIKKTVYTKNFGGGDVVSIFGGAEINLTQADFEGKVVIEMVQIFGGAKLIVPPHWQIRSEMVAVFGGIEDKRTPQANYDSNKVVILNGTTFFGGIEIKSY